MKIIKISRKLLLAGNKSSFRTNPDAHSQMIALDLAMIS